MNPTPGPWKLRKEERPSGIPRIIIGDGFNDIGEVYTCADESFGWPDARLIAAAPELLEAAKEMTRQWREAYDNDLIEQMPMVVKHLEDAIAKAESSAESSNRLEKS